MRDPLEPDQLGDGGGVPAPDGGPGTPAGHGEPGGARDPTCAQDEPARGRPGLPAIIARGLGKRCPHCGRGAMFRRWTRLRSRCPACGIELLRNQGDAWGFLLLVDRGAFIFPVVVALYFGVHLWSPVLFVLLGLGIAALFVVTTPNRYGLCVALDYFTRAVADDPDDDLPDLRRAFGERCGEGR